VILNDSSEVRSEFAERNRNFRVRVSSPLTVLVFADDDYELLYASPAARHGAASPWDATAPTRNASLGEAFWFTTPA
jgi:hypothetical protein